MIIIFFDWGAYIAFIHLSADDASCIVKLRPSFCSSQGVYFLNRINTMTSEAKEVQADLFFSFQY